MRVQVLLNHAAGALGVNDDPAAAQRVKEKFAAANLEADVRAEPGERLTAAAKRAAASGVDAVVAAGGDGTVSAVASGVVGTGVPLGVLPRGTLNHFAKDLGLPLTIEEAIATIAAGHTRPIDVGEVNDRIFINNASIGAYPKAVLHRNLLRYTFGQNKWLAMLRGAMSVFARMPMVQVRIDSAEQTYMKTTPFVFVGNNEYQMHLLSLGKRSCLDKGVLSLYLTSRTGRWALVRLSFRAFFNRLDQARDFYSACLPEFWVDTPKPSVHVAVDGEVQVMTTPLHFKVRPGALRVIVPAPPPEPRPSAA
jgi:diacylglycerol kinase family enzyme